ncbi:hypothetical protein PMHK_34380 [Pseudomonas sp. MHK4]|jgi:hypothetical protein
MPRLLERDTIRRRSDQERLWQELAYSPHWTAITAYKSRMVTHPIAADVPLGIALNVGFCADVAL